MASPRAASSASTTEHSTRTSQASCTASRVDEGSQKQWATTLAGWRDSMRRPHVWPAPLRQACVKQQLRAHLVQQLRALVPRGDASHCECRLIYLLLVTSARRRAGQLISDDTSKAAPIRLGQRCTLQPFYPRRCRRHPSHPSRAPSPPCLTQESSKATMTCRLVSWGVQMIPSICT